MALTLRRQGGSYRKIADQLATQPGISDKYSEGSAYSDVMAELLRMSATMSETADAVRYLELERIDEMFASIWPYAKQGDYQAIERVLRLMEARGKYLGLFATEKAGPRGAGGVNSTTTTMTNDGTTLSIREVIVQLTGVDPETAPDMIDVTPSPALEEPRGSSSESARVEQAE